MENNTIIRNFLSKAAPQLSETAAKWIEIGAGEVLAFGGSILTIYGLNGKLGFAILGLACAALAYWLTGTLKSIIAAGKTGAGIIGKFYGFFAGLIGFLFTILSCIPFLGVFLGFIIKIAGSVMGVLLAAGFLTFLAPAVIPAILLGKLAVKKIREARENRISAEYVA